MNTIGHIIYLSKSSRVLHPQEIEILLSTSRRNNIDNNITGILLYAQSYFLQVLEGPTRDLNELFKRIATDNRHYQIKLLSKKKITNRKFPKWKMGFYSPEEDNRALNSTIESTIENTNESTIDSYSSLQNYINHQVDSESIKLKINMFFNHLNTPSI